MKVPAGQQLPQENGLEAQRASPALSQELSQILGAGDLGSDWPEQGPMLGQLWLVTSDQGPRGLVWSTGSCCHHVAMVKLTP